MQKYRVRFNQEGRRKIVTGAFTSLSKAKKVAKIINKRNESANARVSKIIKK
jgi:hypothetical protein